MLQCELGMASRVFPAPSIASDGTECRYIKKRNQVVSKCYVFPSNLQHSLACGWTQGKLISHNKFSDLRLQRRTSIDTFSTFAKMQPSRLSAEGSRVDAILSTAASMYPVYVMLGGLLAVLRPESYHWFVSRGPTTYSLALGAIMMVMGLTLRVEDLMEVVAKRPIAVVFGCAAQYTIMPLMGFAAGRLFHLSPDLAAGLVLLACCPGGTASNVVTFIANGDVPLSVMMTVCSTFAAVLLTPLLTQLLAGAYVPVNSAGLAISTLQVVLAPVLAGAWMKSAFPSAAMRVAPYCPLAAVLISSLLACSFAILVVRRGRCAVGGVCGSVFSANLPVFMVDSKVTDYRVLGGVLGALLMLHGAGFLLGYFCSAAVHFLEPQRRAVSIEVGMQNSSLAVLLASKHFVSPTTALPAALSAILMNVMGSALAVAWRHFGAPSSQMETPLLEGEQE